MYKINYFLIEYMNILSVKALVEIWGYIYGCKFGRQWTALLLHVNVIFVTQDSNLPL